MKLYISSLNHGEIQEHTVVSGCGDLSRIQESKKSGLDKDNIQAVKLAGSKKGTTVLTTKDILKKENPHASL